MTLLSRFADVIDRVNDRAGHGVAWLVIIMVLVQFAVVILRYVFAVGSAAAQEAIWVLHGVVFMIGAGYTLRHDGHVRVDVFYRDASPRMRAVVDLAGALVLLVPTCVLILWLSLPYVARSWAVLEGSVETGGLPLVFAYKTVILVFAVLLGLQGLSMAARGALKIAGPDGRAGGTPRRGL